MHKLAIFASGTGSNAKKIIEYFKNNKDIEVKLVLSNKETAPVLEMARSHNIEALVMDKDLFHNEKEFISLLNQREINCIILAGFLWLIPPYLVRAFPNKIINIHPALLPNFGGKGMYGIHVHRAVKKSGNKTTGITIHYINERYDEGEIVFQAQTSIEQDDTPEMISQKVRQLEHQFFAPIIEQILTGNH